MRRLASVWLLVALLLAPAAASADECWFDSVEMQLKCSASGDDPVTTVPGGPNDPATPSPLRYVYTRTDPLVGNCWYGSTTPGGLDSWNPANDRDVLAVVSALPRCPATAPAVDAAGRAWEVFRAFPLAAPEPALQPSDNGVVGLPTYLATATPPVITHDEVLPDGRPLAVRASVSLLTVDWADRVTTRHEPDQATPFPSGAVTHTYATKTCTEIERIDRNEGPRCHPTLVQYSITVTFTWTGEWSTGSAWQQLGTLNRVVTVDYDVDEVLGVLQAP